MKFLGKGFFWEFGNIQKQSLETNLNAQIIINNLIVFGKIFMSYA